MAAKNPKLLETCIDIAFQLGETENQVEELVALLHPISFSYLHAKDKGMLSDPSRAEAFDRLRRMVHLIDWVLMFKSTYNIPFEVWSEIASHCVTFLRDQWERGPITFKEFFEGDYRIKYVIANKKNQLRQNPRYTVELSKKDEYAP